MPGLSQRLEQSCVHCGDPLTSHGSASVFEGSHRIKVTYRQNGEGQICFPIRLRGRTLADLVSRPR